MFGTSFTNLFGMPSKDVKYRKGGEFVYELSVMKFPSLGLIMVSLFSCHPFLFVTTLLLMKASAMSKIKTDYPQLMPLWVAVFVDILGFTIILPFLAPLSQIYTTSPLTIGLLLSSNAIFGFFFGPILGKLSDRYGRKPLLLISQAGTTLGFIILAFSNSLEMLFLARIVDGIFGGQFPISKAVIGDVVAPKDRGKQMTNIGVAFTLAAVLGPGFGGILADQFGIIGPGLAATAISVFTFTFTLVRLPESLPTKIPQRPEWMVQMEVYLAKHPELKENPSILKNKNAVYVLALYAFLVLAATTFQTTFSIFGDSRLGLSPTGIGLLFSSMGIFQVVFRKFFFNPIRDRLGDTRTAFLGLGNYILAYFLLSFVLSFWDMMLVLFYISFSGACSRGILNAFASRTADSRNQGKIMGITTSLESASQIFGPIVGSLLLGLSSIFFYSGTLVMFSVIAFGMATRLFKIEVELDQKNQWEQKSPIPTGQGPKIPQDQ